MVLGSAAVAEMDGVARAAELMAQGDALVFAAGAGMGVDSGLPDFRGSQGFWAAYPAYAKLGLRFEQLANPHWFEQDPHLAWGFYGHRMMLYRRTRPHSGFGLLRKWAEQRPCYVFTSNVDGHFQKAGFAEDSIVEVHGTLDWLQCVAGCSRELFSSAATTVEVDEATFRAADPLPRCLRCGALARPNVLMFGDFDWFSERTEAQLDRFRTWLQRRARLVVIECGAGSAVPTVRRQSEALVEQFGANLIRINPREPGVPAGQIGLPYGAVEALTAIENLKN
ncbi:MAG: SIR2 family NAD-dependent protein deacylase [Candidatus Xenobia bacterium]